MERTSGTGMFFLILIFVGAVFFFVWVTVVNNNDIFDVDVTLPGSVLEDVPVDTNSILSFVEVDLSESHAEQEHPETYKLVRKCLQDKGPYMSFRITRTRFLRVCLVEDGKIGFQILDIEGDVVKEVTCYIKERMHSLGEVLKYASRQGYVRVKNY